jgi:hypothetical protein
VAVNNTFEPPHTAVPGEGVIITDAVKPELGLTVINTVSLNEHPPLVDETIYCVVALGVAIGLAMVGLLNPVVGVHA